MRRCGTRLALALLGAWSFEIPEAAARGSIQVPLECGTEDEFHRELQRLLGRDDPGAQRVSLVISPRDPSGQHTLRLRLSGKLRELRDPDCRALFRSAIVVAAAELNPSAPTVVEPNSSAPPDREMQRSEPSARGESKDWGVRGDAATGAMTGLLPGLAPLLELGGAAEGERWAVAGTVRFLPWSGTTNEEGRGVSVWALGGQLAAVFEPVSPLRLSTGVATYRLQGRGHGVVESLTDTVWSVAPMVEAALVPLRADALRLEIGLQGYRFVTRPRFEIRGFGEIYRVSPWGGALIVRLASPLL